MIRRKNAFRTETRENIRGGEGTIFIEHLLESKEYFNKGRMFSKITIAPGCSVGEHTHTGEIEAFYILKGEATVTDNGQTSVLRAGDVLYTQDGGSHSLTNNADTDLEYLAIIISK